MKYVQYLNELLGKETSKSDRLVLYGQNIAAGSCLSGLTRGLKVGKGGLVINTPNSENTLAGLGFGMMLGGISSIFIMKQQDFLLLGLDQLTDTYNFIRRKKPTASFTILFIIVDDGYGGLQSSLNNFGDFCSMARIPGFTITNGVDAQEIINTHLVSPGFRIIGVSQRLFKTELPELNKIYSNGEKTIFQYTEGDGATIACFNAAFPYGLELSKKLKEKNIDSSLFSINAATPVGWDKIIDNLKKTKKLVIIDDSKSENHSYDNLLVQALLQCRPDTSIVVKREFASNDWLYPNADQLTINYDDIISKLLSKKISNKYDQKS